MTDFDETDSTLFERRNESEILLREAVTLSRAGRLREASGILDRVMEMQFDAPMLFENMRALQFWLNRLPRIETLKSTERAYGEFLVTQFDAFEEFVALKGGRDLPLFEPLRAWVFSEVKRTLSAAYQEHGERAILYPLARALMELGEYPQAADTYEFIRKEDRYNAAVLAMLCEAHWRMKDDRRAKAFLREALFYDPLSVPFSRMSAPMVHDLNAIAQKEGFVEKEETALWLGVYGEISGMLGVKKKLTPQESATLRKEVARLEAEYKDVSNRRRTEPRLLLAYLWLHAQCLIDGSRDTRMVLGKIAAVNKAIGDHYEQMLVSRSSDLWPMT